MITETAILNIIPGQQLLFEKAFAKAEKIISKSKGYVHHELLKCMEKEMQYILLVKWETIEDHVTGFRKSAAYQEWKKLLHHYYNPFPEVLHYAAI